MRIMTPSSKIKYYFVNNEKLKCKFNTTEIKETKSASKFIRKEYRHLFPKLLKNLHF